MISIWNFRAIIRLNEKNVKKTTISVFCRTPESLGQPGFPLFCRMHRNHVIFGWLQSGWPLAAAYPAVAGAAATTCCQPVYSGLENTGCPRTTGRSISAGYPDRADKAMQERLVIPEKTGERTGGRNYEQRNFSCGALRREGDPARSAL